ncbi:MAG: type II toxin-antitoxin system VapB family antitoxin [Acidobacteriota bacterium]
MALNIKNEEVVKLVEEMPQRTGVSKTEAIRQALTEKRDRLTEEQERRVREMDRLLKEEVWPFVQPDALGHRMTKQEREEILGYGPNGV